MLSRSSYVSSVLFFLGLVLLTTRPAAAQQAEDENLMPENLTQILKEEWTFLKDQTDAFLASIEKRGEFETTPEFELRVSNLKAAYINRINARIRDHKYDRRTFGVLLKASLATYDANAGVYSVKCFASVEAPYDIPDLITFVPTNPYLAIADTIRGGYRASKLYLKFKPDLKWKVARDVAQSAKGSEAEVFFRIRFVIDLSQEGIAKQAKLKLVPKEIMLVNRRTRTMYWREEIQ